MKNQQIKLFHSNDFPEIEGEVNKWLKTRANYIVSIATTVIPSQDFTSHCMIAITIVYEE